MEKKKIIIIGAGIAGMSAGCYGQMNGYDTEIYKMHDKYGGLKTPGLSMKLLLSIISDRLPGFDNFYMTGQWVSSPGTPGALRTGRKVIQDICKEDRKKFQTSIP